MRKLLVWWGLELELELERGFRLRLRLSGGGRIIMFIFSEIDWFIEGLGVLV